MILGNYFGFLAICEEVQKAAMHQFRGAGISGNSAESEALDSMFWDSMLGISLAEDTRLQGGWYNPTL